MEDEVVIARASSGLALRGTHVGISDQGGRRALKQVLRRPEECKLTAPDQAYRMETISFSSIDASKSFCEAVEKSGWSFAVSVAKQLAKFGGKVSAGMRRDKKKEETMFWEQLSLDACQMHYWYMPRASFNIPRHQMRLNEEALDDVRRVQTLIDAEKFLCNYNSHVSTGRYHIGGVLFKGVTIMANSSTKLESMLNTAAKNFDCGIEGNYMGFKAGGPKLVAILNEDSSSSTERTSGQDATIETVAVALGPQTSDEGKFKAGLEDKSTWYIIDSSEEGVLVPIWEIALFENSKDLRIRKSCDLLCDAWQRCVSPEAHKNDRLFELLQSSHTTKPFISNSLACSLLLTEDEATASLKTKLNKINGFGDLSTSPQSPQELKDILAAVWIAASEMNDSIKTLGWDARHLLLKLPEFDNLLLTIAQSKESDMNAGKQLIRFIISRDMEILLDKAGLSLKEPVKALLRNPVQEELTQRWTPGQHYSPGRNPVQEELTPLTKGLKLEGYLQCYTYNGDMLVDRPMESCEDAHKRMMDCIRHRMEPFASVLSKQRSNSADDFDCFFAVGDSVNKGTSYNETTKDINPNSSPFMTLVQLLLRSDLLAQIALFQLLLEQRFAVPLVVLHKSFCIHTETGKINGFVHLAEALDFVQVKLESQEILSIAEDTKLPRVVFISNRKVASRRETADMANEVMNCQLPSRHLKGHTGDGPTVIEFGIGFLRTPDNQLQEHTPCLVLCVWGDHNQLGEFLGQVADMIVVETEPDKKASSLPWTEGHPNVDILYWNINSEKKGLSIDKDFKRMWGSFKELTEDIRKYLVRAINLGRFKGRNGQAATLKECLSGIPSLNKETPISNIANRDDVERARDSLRLQKTFAEEAHLYFESLRQKQNKEKLEQKMREIQRERASAADEVQKLPILRFFLELLSEKHHVKRKIGIVHFQLSIDKKLQWTLEKTAKTVDEAFDASRKKPESFELKHKYRVAKQDHVNQMLGLEHLWRELSHIFVAEPSKRELPRLAAHHLLDGFPLEILDGEAAMFHKLWVETVLVELDTVLLATLKHKPKVFVLSIVGLQSSGKSTLLNLMFGTQLKTSAGQCTRGVYLQLVKSEWREFDYVLLLDTEGIRAPEYYGLQDAESKDNRLATFAILPADACIIMVANEEDNGLKEVLPMVVLAFQGSAMADKYAGRLQAKLFFVYRSVDTNDVKKLKNNQQKLLEDLQDASLKIAGIGQRSSQASIGLLNILVDVQEERSDVKYLGSLKKGNIPPLDIPDWDYGRKVVELRKYIHKRVLDGRRWEGHKLVDCIECLRMVWQCIGDANFELRFLNYIELEYYHQLQDKLGSCRGNVGKKCVKEIERLEGELQVDKGTDHSSNSFWNIFKSRVEETVREEGEEVNRILEQKKWQRWKVEESARWIDFCLDQDRQWKARLEDCIAGVLKFDIVVEEYSKKIQKEIQSDADQLYVFNNASPDQEDRMKSHFEELFGRILQEVEEKHPPLAKKVFGYVDELYVNSRVVGEKFEFSKKVSLVTIKSNLNIVKKTVLGGRDKEQLDSKMERLLKDAKQYAHHLVEEMFRFTDKLVAGESKDYQKCTHTFVKDALTERLITIQRKWDMQHNVSERLTAEKPRLWLFYKNCANGVERTKMLSMEVGQLLQTKMVDSFKVQLSKSVSDKLQAEAWVRNWKVMRAHLDLHLVELIEAKQTDELLHCVTNGTRHYRRIVGKLLEKEINDQSREDNPLWAWFVKSILEAVKLAAVSAVGSNSLSKSSIFLGELKEQLLKKTESSELAKNISLVNDEVYSKHGDVIDFLKVGEDVNEGVDCVELDLTSSIKELIELVKTRMIASASESARPRCEEECPRCGLTCLLPAGHTGRHDTLHQPEGLSGVHDNKTRELSAYSCSKYVTLEWSMSHPSRGIKGFVPFKDFEKHYAGWTLPSQGFGTPKVREYIFAHYQQDLLKRHLAHNPGIKMCTNIPSEYGHDLKGLRCELENVIQSHTSL